MRRINKIGLICSVTFLLILMVPIPIGAQERDFEEGDFIIFGEQRTSKRTVEISGDKTDGYYSLDQENRNYEIEDISSDTLDYTKWDEDGNTIDYRDVRYDSDLIEDYNVLIFQPIYRTQDNDLILTAISGQSGLYFIDPEWDNINDDLVQNIEDWEYTYWDGDRDVTIDMEDFEDSTESFSLMGDNNLQDGLDAFTDTTHKWFGEFKFDGVMHYWDNDDVEYKELDSYEFKWEIEFTEGGTLSKVRLDAKGEDTNKFSFEYSYLLQNKAVSLGALGGGLIPGVTHAFELPIMILAVVSSTVALRFIGKRRT
ncbi:MAG: hypothetical protein JSW11_16120 [Candidatus Heimdallarchaeota archaeon]|nr:MAG: hypothetical protein JSW11_16120 [Candidatus Heimdallarchaeota archaeon]